MPDISLSNQQKAIKYLSEASINNPSQEQIREALFHMFEMKQNRKSISAGGVFPILMLAYVFTHGDSMKFEELTMGICIKVLFARVIIYYISIGLGQLVRSKNPFSESNLF